MDAEARTFLKNLVESHSPSGFEQAAQKIVRDRLEGVVDEVRTDVCGNVIAVTNPGADLRVMLAGHCDEIGLMVTYIDENGYIYFAAIGGVDASILGGQRVEIHNTKGIVPGVIGKKPIHLMDRDEVGKALKMKDCWIDIGASSQKDAMKAVEIGDSITISRDLLELRNNLVSARAMDDRVGVWTIVETMRKIQRMKLKCSVYCVTTVQEEIGSRGAKTACYGIDPHVGIAIDVGFASDSPGSDKKQVGDVSLGKGPILCRGANINPPLGRLMESAAKRKKIPFQMQAEPSATGTDACMLQVNRSGAAAALVSVPNRYMHTPVEVVSLKDLDNTVALLAATIGDLKPGIDFTP